jgi:hypothetical protein
LELLLKVQSLAHTVSFLRSLCCSRWGRL